MSEISAAAPTRAVRPLGARLRDYAELGRISNLPTCVSNVLVGCAIGAAGTEVSWTAAAGAAAAVVLLYVGGMALNDAVDAEFDTAKRSQRPIPSGRISVRAAYAFVTACLGVALVVLAAFGTAALAAGGGLVAAIVAYDVLHKRHPASVLLMGLCRGMVYVTAAAAVAWPVDARVAGTLAAGLALYTVGLTVVARSETAAQLDARRWIAVALPLLVLSAALVVRPAQPLWAAAAGLALAAWLARAVRYVFARPPQTMKAVLTWISGMSLVDAFFLALLGHPLLALAAAACTGVATWGHRRILGT